MPAKINIPLKPCEECRTLFRPRPDRAAKIRFCKQSCYVSHIRRTADAERIQKACIRCGKEFSAIRARANAQYCSMSCTNFQVVKTCERCGQVFVHHRYRKFKGSAKFTVTCGLKCPKRNVVKQCLRCGRSYNARWNDRDRRRYCSYSCRSKRPKTFFDPATTHRTCRYCGETKLLKRFSTSKKCVGGRTFKCSKCAFNREAKQRHDANYYQKHKEKLIRQSVAWNKAHPTQVKVYIQKVRAVRATAIGSFTPQEWREVLDLYGHKCLACGATDKKLSADHVVPLSRGGTNFISNIQPLCRSCNSRKNAKTVDYRPTAYALGTAMNSS